MWLATRTNRLNHRRKLSVVLNSSEKAAYEDEERAEQDKASEDEAGDLDEKWVKTKSLTKTHMIPIELPLESDNAPIDIEDKDLLSALKSGELQILQLPPNCFSGDFLAEKEVDEQELESIEVNLLYWRV